jgi:hypothetical protein
VQGSRPMSPEGYKRNSILFAFTLDKIADKHKVFFVDGSLKKLATCRLYLPFEVTTDMVFV